MSGINGKYVTLANRYISRIVILNRVCYVMREILKRKVNVNLEPGANFLENFLFSSFFFMVNATICFHC